jgi:hypothetical protein
MSQTRGRTALVLLFAAITGGASPSWSADPPQTEDHELQLDQTVQALKDEVVEFVREAQSVEDDVTFPPETRLEVYLGVKVSGLLMKDVSVTLDDHAAENYTYTDRDARSMLSDLNLQRLLRANVGNGAHRIRVAFTAQMVDAKPDAEPITDSYEAIFDKGNSSAELEFVVSRPTRLSKPRLSMKQWRAAR